MDIMLLLLSGKFLEPIWGSKEFLRFVLIVNTLSGVASFLLMVWSEREEVRGGEERSAERNNNNKISTIISLPNTGHIIRYRGE